MPVKLDHHHRVTAQRLFGHPINHNIRWPDVVSLLGRVGDVYETHRGNWAITDENGTHSFGSARHRVLTEEQVMRVRAFLRSAGLSPGGSRAA